MNCEKIKFRAIQNPVSHSVQIEVYRELQENNNQTEWMMTDRFNELSGSELKCLADYIYSLFKKKH